MVFVLFSFQELSIQSNEPLFFCLILDLSWHQERLATKYRLTYISLLNRNDPCPTITNITFMDYLTHHIPHSLQNSLSSLSMVEISIPGGSIIITSLDLMGLDVVSIRYSFSLEV